MLNEFGMMLRLSSLTESEVGTMVLMRRFDAGRSCASKVAGSNSRRMTDMNFVKFKGVLYLKNAAF